MNNVNVFGWLQQYYLKEVQFTDNVCSQLSYIYEGSELPMLICLTPIEFWDMLSHASECIKYIIKHFNRKHRTNLTTCTSHRNTPEPKRGR